MANPLITRLWPPANPAGGDGFYLGVECAFYSAGAVLYFGATALQTASTGDSSVGMPQLVAYVPASLLETPGSIPITVKNADNSVSSPVNFSLTAGNPSTLRIDDVSPPAVVVNTAVRLTLTGNKFNSTSIVYLQSSLGDFVPLTTHVTQASDSTFSLQADLTADVSGTPGTFGIYVRNGNDPSSNTATFEVYDGYPESPHPYGDGPFNLRYTEPGGPANLWITFDPQANFFDYGSAGFDHDYYSDTLTVTDGGAGNYAAQFRSVALAGRTLQIPGDTVEFTLTRGQGTLPLRGGYFGFRVIDIRTSAPPANSYRLKNRNSNDQGDGAYTFLPGYAQHPSYGGPETPVLSPQVLPLVFVDSDYSYQFVFPSATGAVTWSLVSGTLPALTLDPQTGVLSGHTPAFPIESRFIVRGTDSISNFAEASFLLRIYQQPVIVSGVSLSGNAKAGPLRRIDFPWAFALNSAFYAVLYSKFTDEEDLERQRFFVRKSTDHGTNWSTVNQNDANSGTRLDCCRVGALLYVVFWQHDANYFEQPVLKRLDLTTGLYTTLYTGRFYKLYTSFSEVSSVTRLFVKPDASIVQFLQTVPAVIDNQYYSARITMVTGNGVVDTLISDNVPPTGDYPGPFTEALISSIVMDASGAFHVFFKTRVVANFSLPPARMEHFYRRVAPDGALGTLTPLNASFLNNYSARGLLAGYVRQADNELVIPLLAARYPRYGLGDNYPSTGTPLQQRIGVLRGSPLAAPQFTYEFLDSLPAHDQTSRELPPQEDDGVYAFMDADGSDVIVFLAGDGAGETNAWMVRNRRDGQGWGYRELLYHSGELPFGPSNQHNNSLGCPVLLPDDTAPVGYRFLAASIYGGGEGGTGGETDSESAPLFLIDPPRVKAIACGNPAAATVGAPYNHTFPALGAPPLTFAITGGALPPGLTLNPETGQISGSPNGAQVCRGIVHLDPTTRNDQGQAIESIWESGLARGSGDHASRMIRVGALDVWVRGEGELVTTVAGPEKKKTVRPKLLTASGVPAPLTEEPGTMYQEKLDLSKIENYTVEFKTNAVDAWFELSGFTSYTKPDLFNK